MASSILRDPYRLSKEDLEKEVQIEIEENGAKKTVTVKLGLYTNLVEKIKNNMFKDPLTRIVIEQFPQPIIWILSCDTACTDGIRIAMNPIFAYMLLNKGREAVKTARASDPTLKDEVKINSILYKYIEFVIIHECYHCIYEHFARAKQVPGAEQNHEMTNTAMDAEINRDIEFGFGGKYKGICKEMGFVWDAERFPYQSWKEIFEAYTKEGKQAPKHEKPFSPEPTAPPPGGPGGPTPPPPPHPDFDNNWVTGYNETMTKLNNGEVSLDDLKKYFKI